MAQHLSKQKYLLHAFVLFVAYCIQFLTLVFLFPVFDSTVFAISVLPAVLGGWLYGRKWGVLVGIGSAVLALVFQAVMGLWGSKYLTQSFFGGPVVVLVGVAFGHLRDMERRAKRETKARIEAEETKRTLEQQLLQSQKMEAVGTLAGGVAHDMNNILGVIMSSASVLKTDLQSGQCQEEDIDAVLHACRRGRDLTRNLLGFARKGTFVKDSVDLNATVEDALRLLCPTINKNIVIETELGIDLFPIFGDRSQIEQVIVNICINAIEAIETQGRIHIRTWNGTDGDMASTSLVGPSGSRSVYVEISDTGPGMTAEVAASAFEPFFTTKEPGRGTGLGLSMTYGTITNHGGSVDLVSSPGKGTTITLILPASEHAPVQKKADRARTEKKTTGFGQILLVDDEPLIRKSSERMLKQLGYSVVTAESGESAVHIFKEKRAEIDLIILDLVMPGLDGEKTFLKLKEIEPSAPVLICSGYSKDENIEALIRRGAAGFIQKPFDAEQLSDHLTSVFKGA